jgi:hypothetical protein
MIDRNALKYGDIIWNIDINGTDVMLRKIEVGHLHQLAGSYWISAQRGSSMDGIMFNVVSPYLFYSQSEALQYLRSMYMSLDVLLEDHAEWFR